MFKNNVLNWRRIIDHELFHAAVFQMYYDPQIIPSWFNESVAYLVGKNSDFDDNKFINCLESNFEQIKELMVTNLLVNANYEFAYEVIYSFGQFFGMSFPKEKIRSFFFALQNQIDFEITFYEEFGVSLIDFIDDWYEFIISGKMKPYINLDL